MGIEPVLEQIKSMPITMILTGIELGPFRDFDRSIFIMKVHRKVEKSSQID